MQVINTNISSLNSQRHLNSTQSALSTSLERLSSGKRINNAKDDAAGLGISERMTSQINGMNQAIRNARDGISMSQTAEGALSTSSDMLQRIRTLAVQSSNATNASLDRQAIQDEVNELTAELNRIAQTTSFNGQKLLDGTLGTQNYQVGANAGELISASGTNFLTHVYGTYRMQEAGVAAADTSVVTGGNIEIAGSLGKQTVTAAAGASALDIANQINTVTSKTGVTAKAETTMGVTFSGGGSFTIELNGDNTDAVTISFNVATADNTADNYAEAVNAINAHSAKTGVTAEYDSSINGVKLTHATGEDITIKNTNASADKLVSNRYAADGTATANADIAKDASVIATGQITYDSSSSFSVNDASGLVSSGGALKGSTLHSVASLDLTTFESAQLAIAICDSAINRIDKEMSRYGALQSRFDATIKNLEVNSENTSNARSRIQDADYASETAEYSRTTILQQAGTAMLTQANQQPQTVLSLIG